MRFNRAVDCAAGVLYEIRNGHGRAIDFAVLSAAASSGFSAAGFVQGGAERTLADFSLDEFLTGICGFGANAWQATVSGANEFDEIARSPPGEPCRRTGVECV